jgi:hypothetical protein
MLMDILCIAEQICWWTDYVLLNRYAERHVTYCSTDTMLLGYILKFKLVLSSAFSTFSTKITSHFCLYMLYQLHMLFAIE